MMFILKTALYPAVLTGVFSAAYALLCSRAPRILVVALFFTAAWAGLLFFADKMIGLLFRMEKVAAEDAPELYAIAEEISGFASMKMPEIFILPSASGQILSGRSLIASRIAISHGVFQAANTEEIKGVLAQAISRLRKKEELLVTAAAVTGGLVLFPFLAFFGDGSRERGKLKSAVYKAAFYPLHAAANFLASCSVSSRYIFDADAEGALLCGAPLYLSSGLHKLEMLTRHFPLRNMNPSLQSLCLFKSFSSSPASIHPEIEERISILDRMARKSPLVQTLS